MDINAIRYIKRPVQCLICISISTVVVLILETSVTFLSTGILALYTILLCDIGKEGDVSGH